MSPDAEGLSWVGYETQGLSCRAERPDTGYLHDSRADKDSYPHNGRADKDSYPHDGRADKNPYPHDRHKQCIMLSL